MESDTVMALTPTMRPETGSKVSESQMRLDDPGMSEKTPISVDSPPSHQLSTPSINLHPTKQTLPVKNGPMPSLRAFNSSYTSSEPSYYRSLDERRSTSPISSTVDSQTPPLEPEHLAFMKVIAVILKGQPFSYTKDFISEVSNLAAAYFDQLTATLHDYTEMQRRRKALKSDMQMTLQSHQISPGDLLNELERLQIIKSHSQNDLHIINENLKAIEAQIEPIEESRVFFDNEHYDIAELVPKQNNNRPSYIPLYLPELPPDHTYQNTPKYLERLSDLKEMRLRLVEQSRLTEKLLYNLIDDDEVRWRKNLELELAKIDDNQEENLTELTEESIIKQVNNNNNKEDEQQDKEDLQFESTPGLGKSQPFDIEAYARKRQELRNRQEAAAIAKAEKRKKNVCMQAEEYFSPYATKRPTKAVKDYFNQIMEREFTATIQSIRRDAKRRDKKLKLILEIKRRKDAEREQARESEEVKFGIDFGRMGQSDDDDDDDDDSDKELNDNFPQFDFPSMGLTNSGGNSEQKELEVRGDDDVEGEVAVEGDVNANVNVDDSNRTGEAIDEENGVDLRNTEVNGSNKELTSTVQSELLPTESSVTESTTDAVSNVVGRVTLEKGDNSENSDEDLFDDIMEENEEIEPSGVSNAIEGDNKKKLEEEGRGGLDFDKENDIDIEEDDDDLEEQLNRELEQDVGDIGGKGTMSEAQQPNGLGDFHDDDSDSSDDLEEV